MADKDQYMARIIWEQLFFKTHVNLHHSYKYIFFIVERSNLQQLFVPYLKEGKKG